MAEAAELARWRDRLDRPTVTVLFVLVAYTLFLLLRLDVVGGNLSTLIRVGDAFAEPARLSDEVAVLPGSVGYDGQFFYALARHPLLAPGDPWPGVRLDSPAYRQQRILYPLLVHGMSLGQPSAVPLVMVQVNLLALGILAWAGARLAQAGGWHALWGSALALYPGFLYTLSHDLAEILAMALLALSLLGWLRRKLLISVSFMTLALLAKETVALVALAALISGLYTAYRRRPDWQRKILVGGLPLAVYGAWSVWLYGRWQEWPIRGGTDNLGMPVGGLGGYLSDLLTNAGQRPFFSYSIILGLLVWTLLVVVAARQNSAGTVVWMAWIVYGAFALLFTTKIWVEELSYLRALAEWYLLGTLLLLHAGRSLRNYVALLLGPGLWALTFVRLLAG